MTQKLILAGEANALFSTEPSHEQETDTRWNLRESTIFAWVTLAVIVVLMAVHSGYWALALPSWLSLVFMLGAGSSARKDDWNDELTRGSH